MNVIIQPSTQSHCLSLFAAIVGLVSISCAHAQWSIVNLHPANTTVTSTEAYAAGAQQAGYFKQGVQVTRAAMWSGTAGTFVDLHPTGAIQSVAWGAGDGQQVGSALIGMSNRASLWSGSANSWVDLHQQGWVTSEALDVHAGQQVGRATFSGAGPTSAILWNGTAASFVNLTPPMTGSARVNGTDGVQQVGLWTPQFVSVAAMWSGTAASHVDLHPPSTVLSEALAVSNGQQVGFARLPVPQPGGSTTDVASLWTGSAASWVNLNPAGSSSSRASGVHNGIQVGFATVGTDRRASLWRGTPESWFDLHALLPAEFSRSEATDIAVDDGSLIISGFGFNAVTNRTEALIWKAPADIVFGNGFE